MTLPFTTYLAFVTIMGGQGWSQPDGGGFLLPWVPHLGRNSLLHPVDRGSGSQFTRRPAWPAWYLSAGRFDCTQLIYVGALMLMIILAKAFPAYL
jgi:hypothetical protein